MSHAEDQPPDHRPDQGHGEHDIIRGVILELFARHHGAMGKYVAGLVAEEGARIDGQFAILNAKIDRLLAALVAPTP